jgi:hypothetical protein
VSESLEDPVVEGPSEPGESVTEGESLEGPVVEGPAASGDSVGTPVQEPPAQGPVEEPKAPLVGFKERALAVLFLPERAFGDHDATWGWAKPWLLVAAVGVLIGAFTLLWVDLGAVLQGQAELAMDQMPSQQRKMIEGNPAAKAMTEKMVKYQVFFAKVRAMAGPPISGLGGLLFAGGFLFLITRFVRGPDTPTDLFRCISLAAYVSLVNALGFVAVGVGVLTGNAMPSTGPAGLASPVSQAVLYTALERLDPFVIYYYVLLAVGLHASLKLSKKQALQVSVGAYATCSAILIGLAATGTALQGLGMGGRS